MQIHERREVVREVLTGLGPENRDQEQRGDREDIRGFESRDAPEQIPSQTHPFCPIKMVTSKWDRQDEPRDHEEQHHAVLTRVHQSIDCPINRSLRIACVEPEVCIRMKEHHREDRDGSEPVNLGDQCPSGGPAREMPGKK